MSGIEYSPELSVDEGALEPQVEEVAVAEPTPAELSKMGFGMLACYLTPSNGAEAFLPDNFHGQTKYQQ